MQLRGGDAAYRYGGEELVLVLRDAHEREAIAVAERVRTAVEAAGLPHPDDPSGVVTVSIGVATGKGDAPDLLARADRALYDAKNSGRNGVRVSEGVTTHTPARRRTDVVEQPLLRHLRGLLEISRAAASGRGAMPVLETMAELLRSELGFHTVAVNLREGHDDDLRVVLVVGDEEARSALLGNVNPWATWHPLLDRRTTGSAPRGCPQAPMTGTTPRTRTPTRRSPAARWARTAGTRRTCCCCRCAAPLARCSGSSPSTSR